METFDIEFWGFWLLVVMVKELTLFYDDNYVYRRGFVWRESGVESVWCNRWLRLLVV